MHDLLIDYLYQYSNVQIALIFILCLLIPGCFGLWLFNRHLEPNYDLSLDTNGAITFFSQCGSAAYGILIGLTAVACWDNFEEAQRIISQETSYIGQFHRLSYGIQSGESERLRQLDLVYLGLLVTDEMPGLAERVTCNATLGALRDLRTELFRIIPSNSKEQLIYADLLQSYDWMTGLRQQRVALALGNAVPGVFWVVIISGGVITLGMMFFVHMPSLLVRYILMTSYCVIMGLMYFLIAVIDHPFKGEIRVSTDAYTQLFQELANGL